MSKMKKKVALAIEHALALQGVHISFGANLSGVIPPIDFSLLAEAAIMAMVEPTHDMVNAAETENEHIKWNFSPASKLTYRGAYCVMMRAALK